MREFPSPWRFLMPWIAILLVAVGVPVIVGERSTGTMGVYRGAGAPTEVAAFERWNGGEKVTYALDFLPLSSWRNIDDPSWWAAQWKDTPYRPIYSVPLLPADGSTLAAGATGAYDFHFDAMARSLIAAGQGDAILRLGWEFNGSWYPWNAAKNPAAFVTYWRRVVDTIRRVPGANFRFDWTANLGTGTIDPAAVYPGDAYVDIIGLDAYDQGWYADYQNPEKRWQALLEQPTGLNWHRAFAAAHNKPLSFPEWGLTIRPDGHGGGDNRYYIERMHAWISANNVAYHAYFEYDASDGNHRMMHGQFSTGAQAFKELFGGKRG